MFVTRPPVPHNPDPARKRALLADPRSFARGLLNAREMGDAARYQALQALVEQLGEPTWDRARGEFYYRFGLSEPSPRGQANAADPWLAGTATTFVVDHLREPAQARLLRDGSVYEGWWVSGETSIEIKAQVQDPCVSRHARVRDSSAKPGTIA